MVIIGTKRAAPMSQDKWDSLLDTSPKVLDDLDEASATQLGKIGIDNLPIEVLAAIPPEPAE